MLQIMWDHDFDHFYKNSLPPINIVGNIKVFPIDKPGYGAVIIGERNDGTLYGFQLTLAEINLIQQAVKAMK